MLLQNPNNIPIRRLPSILTQRFSNIATLNHNILLQCLNSIPVPFSNNTVILYQRNIVMPRHNSIAALRRNSTATLYQCNIIMPRRNSIILLPRLSNTLCRNSTPARHRHRMRNTGSI